MVAAHSCLSPNPKPNSSTPLLLANWDSRHRLPLTMKSIQLYLPVRILLIKQLLLKQFIVYDCSLYVIIEKALRASEQRLVNMQFFPFHHSLSKHLYLHTRFSPSTLAFSTKRLASVTRNKCSVITDHVYNCSERSKRLRTAGLVAFFAFSAPVNHRL